MKTGPGSISKYYVNKGEGDIYKAKVRNLKKLMNDDVESMKQLRKVSTFNRVAAGTAIVGFTTFMVGAMPFLEHFTEVEKPPLSQKSKILMITGGSMLLIANFSFYIRPNPYKAIKIYNSKQ